MPHSDQIEREPIDLAHESDFDLGRVHVSPSLRKISGPAGEVVVEPKVMQVLVALSHPTRTILSRDDLIEKCWDGRIVGDASINRVISLLRSALRDVAGDEAVIDTVARVGYRVLVKGEAQAQGAQDTPQEDRAQSSRAGSLRNIVIAAVLAAAILGGIIWSQMSRSLVDPISIAMVPVELSDGFDPLFGRGLESELRSELSRRQGVTISAPESAMQLAALGTAPDEIGQTLGVDYVLIGRLESTPERIEFYVEAVEVATGEPSFSQVISSADTEASLLPQRAARALMEGLSRPFETAARTDEISQADYFLYLSAITLIRTRGPDQLEQARELLEQVTNRNPRFSQGWSGLAKARFLVGGRTADEQAQAASEAREMAARALELDEGSVEARKIAGLIALDAAERHRLLSEAVALDPGDAEAWFWLSHVNAHPDFAGQELEAMVQAARLDPLWDRTWQAPAYAASAGNLALADELDRKIIAAAAQPWQSALAEARITLRRGNIAEYIRIVRANLEAMPLSAKQVTGAHLSNMRVLLGVEPAGARQAGIAGMIEQVAHGNLPSKSEFDEAGITPQTFWRVVPISIAAPSLFIRDGRADELLAYYDEGLGSPEALRAYGESELRPHHFIPNFAIYLGQAMRDAGRDEEAAAMFELAQASVTRWQASGYPDMTSTIFEANLAAATGERERAISAVRLLVEELGWPYALQSPGVALQGPLGSDPVWADLRDDPELVGILQPVNEVLERERRALQDGGAL